MNHYLRSHTCDKVITVMSNALTPEQGNVLMQRNADFSNLMYSPGKHTHIFMEVDSREAQTDAGRAAEEEDNESPRPL